VIDESEQPPTLKTQPPPAVRRTAGLKSGDELEFNVSGQVITMRPKKMGADDEYTPAQRRSIDRGIEQSEKEYAAGKSYGPFDTAADAIAAIDTNLRRRATAKTSKSTAG
jgi:bifunctional DNA-binding transcriptional regulator/antitoxin component of YhaV-PrlF toxin-antitoxin module